MTRLMVLLRGLVVSWFVLLGLGVPICGELLSTPTSDRMASEAGEMEECSSSDAIFARVGRIVTGAKARTVLLVVTGSHHVGTRDSLSAPSLERAMTASVRSPVLPVYQRISVYRI
jgi:hypothetical protein